MKSRISSFVPFLGHLCALVLAVATPSAAIAQDLSSRLAAMAPKEVVQRARLEGDAARGAILFHQPHLACSKCHEVTANVPSKPGPDLTKLGEKVTAEHLIESVLAPSKSIRDGYAAISIVTADGRSISGLVVRDDAEGLQLRDADGRVTNISPAEIEERSVSKTSLMPAGLVSTLSNEGQFFDLARYVIEIHEGGAKRAKELQPSAALLVLKLPEYENRIDHAALLASANEDAFKRGETIYKRLCINCHGTKDEAGSLPTSLRFASGKFKNGGDPLAMYQTLSHGFGQMAPQTWMVPQEKYDVIHYIREYYLKPHNPSQFFEIDADYIARLPKGDTMGPEPSTLEPWSMADYGSFLIGTYEAPLSEEQLASGAHNIAYKGIAIRLDSGPGGIAKGNHWALYEHDTMRLAALWSAPSMASKARFVDYQGIMFDGAHGVHPKLVGTLQNTLPDGPGWTNPITGAYDDARVIGRDGRRYGPLPRAHLRYRGLYQHGAQVVLSYSVGRTDIMETPQLVQLADGPVFLRILDVGPRERPLTMRAGATRATLAVPQLLAKHPSVSLRVETSGEAELRIAPGTETLRVVLAYPSPSLTKVDWRASVNAPEVDFAALTAGGQARWPEILETEAKVGESSTAFAADILTDPTANPWFCQMRFTGLDFLKGGDRLAACTWDGDVWLVSGLAGLDEATKRGAGSAPLKWKRIASGLFQPLGLKIVGGAIHLTCRDQLVILRDLNGDEETDFYECFNSDHQVTEHFHEFAMGLQTDEQGDFYYAKSARHALKAVVPHHGTLLRVAKDGSATSILANGFRAANGVCLNPDGSFVVTDQEGHWNPKNRINWVRPGGFYGNMFGYHSVTDTGDRAMQQPLCWITNDFDRSPAELLWVPTKSFGPLGGSLINLSYGYGKIFAVPFEKNAGNENAPVQGGMIELPLGQFPTGLIRGRFSSTDECLYACGMFAWAGSVTQPGGLYRVRYTGLPVRLPARVQAKSGKLILTFTDRIDAPSAALLENFELKTWSLKRTSDYGSKHVDEKVLHVEDATLAADGKTLTLAIPSLAPTWSYSLSYKLRDAAGEPFSGLLHGTIHQLNP